MGLYSGNRQTIDTLEYWSVRRALVERLSRDAYTQRLEPPSALAKEHRQLVNQARMQLGSAGVAKVNRDDAAGLPAVDLAKEARVSGEGRNDDCADEQESNHRLCVTGEVPFKHCGPSFQLVRRP
jgi:hypothetical protein